MPDRKLAVVVLAAGLGTRMKSRCPKVLHKVAGRSMLAHVLAAAAHLEPARVVIVAAPGMEPEVETIAKDAGVPFRIAVQNDRLGTGHAVACAKTALEGFHGPDGGGDILIVFGDTPLLRPETLKALCEARRGPQAPAILGLAFRPADTARYGRVVTGPDGQVERIVEHADASGDERQIGLCNAGILLGDGPVLYGLVDRLGKDNAKGEYYLTDVFAMAHGGGLRVRSAEADPGEVLGVDSKAGLARAEALMQARLRAQALENGATMTDPATVWLSWDTRIGRDAVLEPNVVFGPGVSVGDEVEIRAFCHLEGVQVGRGAVIGPFARLRPGTEIGDQVRIGNFVETKNAVFATGAKANHLSYIGDAEVGAAANIGAGTITCNYDGVAKHRTNIGAGAFIGSNTALVAPVTVGAGAIVGAGSTIGGKIEADELVVVRGKERRSPGAAKRFREQRRAQKAKRKEG